jgi:hypothetical protein
MRSGIFVTVAADVFNLSISWTGPLPFRCQIKLKTIRSLLKIKSDTLEHELESQRRSGGVGDGLHRILTGIPNATGEHVSVLCLGAQSS